MLLHANSLRTKIHRVRICVNSAVGRAVTCRKPVPKYSSCPLLPSLGMVTQGLESVLEVQLLMVLGLSQVQPLSRV